VSPTFLLLHGIGLSHRSLAGLAEHLSPAGRVISYDLPGFGSTPRPRHRLTVEDHAALILRELDERDAGPVVVVGHSMGAQFAIEVARQAPGAVTHVVLIGPVVDEKRPTLTAQALALVRDSVAEPPATQLMVALDYLRCGPRWFFTEATAMRDYPTNRAITGIPHPVLVIRGENDPIADAAWCESLASRVSDGRLATIPGHRHNVPHSNPAATAEVIAAFAAAPRREQVTAADAP